MYASSQSGAWPTFAGITGFQASVKVLGLRRRIGEAARSHGVADDCVLYPERFELRAEGQVRFTAVPGDEMISDD